MSPFITARQDVLTEGLPPRWLANNPVSSPPLSLSSDRSAYAEVDGELSLEEV